MASNNLWFIDGRVYDLESFEQLHPGGAALLNQTRGQDVSTMFHTRHHDPTRLASLLKLYAVDSSHRKDSCQERPFLDSKEFLKEVHERLGKDELRDAVWIRNAAFLIFGIVIALFYRYLNQRATDGFVSPWPFAMLMALTRICLTSVGKSYIKQRISLISITLSFLADMEYSCMTLSVLQLSIAGGDDRDMIDVSHIKQLPRLYRLPLYLTQQLLFPLKCLVIQSRQLRTCIAQNDILSWLQLMGHALVHCILLWEVRSFYKANRMGYWLLQFLLTTIYTLILSLSQTTVCQTRNEVDWPEEVIRQTIDVHLTGNPYIDSVLTSGLSCSRSRRLLPFIWSPFAHVVTTKLLQEIAIKKHIQWTQSVDLIIDRFSTVVSDHLTDTTAMQNSRQSLWQEHVSTNACKRVCQYLYTSVCGQKRKDPLKTV